MVTLIRCTFCRVMVRPDAMADHWIIARHYSETLPATRITDARNQWRLTA